MRDPVSGLSISFITLGGASCQTTPVLILGERRTHSPPRATPVCLVSDGDSPCWKPAISRGTARETCHGTGTHTVRKTE
ncbi:hypothetical protein QBC34DRAFT_57259 [Podospora aff. communis PSN243]|uniref:Secreted protein n=1 Tax=Podospora aff. communis PSN243 TaxID=3040156 RepID=A0AAV9GS66_9PEZI|nr:hypothetical protein QBC34DRAFT_57259 [Podospora aff. communis PSN243]